MLPRKHKYLSARMLLLTLAVIVLNALGDLSLTWGMKHLPAFGAGAPLDYLRAMASPFVALGVLMLVLWLLTRMVLMSWADLSFVVPVTCVGYVLVALLGHIFLDEAVTKWRWLGVMLIFAGSTFVGLTAKRPSETRATQ